MDQFAALAETGAEKSPEHFVWSFPGSIMVELSLDVVARLAPQLKNTPQGLLLGDVAGPMSRISDFRALSPAELAGMRTGVPVPSGLTNGAAAMGYFRVQREGELRLTPEDLALTAALFPHPNQVFLLIACSGSDTASASFFFWDGGRMFGDFAFLEFPFDTSLLAAQESARRQKAASARAAELLPSPEILPPPAPRKASKWKKAGWSIAVLLLLSAAGGAYYVERFTPGGLRWPPQWKRPLTATDTNARVAPPLRASLGLQVERQPRGDIRLSWDRTAGPVVEATGGSFIIQDGPTARVIPLDAGLVHSGSLLYTPSTDQVQMRLTVDRAGQPAVTEMVLVVVPPAGAPQLHPLASKNAAPSLKEGLEPDNDPSSAPRVERELKAFVAPTLEVVQAPPVLGLPPAVDPNLRPVANPPSMASGSLFGVPQLVAPRPAAAVPPPGPLNDYLPPEVITRKAPVVPVWFRGPVNKPEQVKVNVTIDEAGKVVKVNAIGSGLTPALIPVALAAAHQWRFKPARLRGQAVRSEVLLNFNFHPRQ